MSRQDILTLAKQGDHRAIALLINEALKSQGIQAKATREQDNLYILLESAHLPSEEACLSVIKKGLERLQIENMKTVTVYGRLNDQQLPTWSHTLELKTISHTQATKEAKETEKETPVPPKSSPLFSQSPHPLEIPLPSTPKTKKPWAYVAVTSLVLIPLSGFVLNNQFNRLRKPNPSANTPEKSAVISVGVKNTPPTTPSPQSQSSLPTKAASLATSSPKPKSSLSTNPTPLTSSSPKLKSSPSIKPTVQASPLPTLKSSPSIKPTPQASQKPIPSPSQPSVIPSPLPSASLLPEQLSQMSLTIKAVGDIIPGTNYPYNKLPENPEKLFENVKPQLAGADIVFGNFESTLTNYPHSSKSIGRGLVFAFRTPPDYTKFLKDAGFDVLNIANNHSFDFHEKGFKDTIDNINKMGMKAFGKKDQIIYETINGVKIAFIGFSNYDGVHNSILDIKGSQALIKKAKEQANIVVISIHAGAEGSGALNVRNKTEFFYGENRGNLVLFSRSAIDAGADLILGHGPHVPRALELYQGKLIAYSLGNFLGYRTLSTSGVLGKSLILEVKLNGQGDFMSGKIIPVQLNNKGIPSIDNDFHSVGLIRDLTQSDFPKTPLKIDEKGQILKK